MTGDMALSLLRRLINDESGFIAVNDHALAVDCYITVRPEEEDELLKMMGADIV